YAAHSMVSGASCHPNCSFHILPSFPTRRSSDPPIVRYRRPARANTPSRENERHRSRVGPSGRRTRTLFHRVVPISERRRAEPDRSEEHTSELQSRENLVCRLLLEKKNKKTNKPI